MHEIPADPGPFAEDFEGSPIRTCLLIVETDVLVDEVTDGLHHRPSCRHRAEQFPTDIL